MNENIDTTASPTDIGNQPNMVLELLRERPRVQTTHD